MKRNQTGAAVLVLTFILMIAATLIFIYSAQNSMLQQKASSNQLQSNQAFEAAQGGLDFGLVYLNANTSTIIANPSNGYINYGSADTNVSNVTLANGGKFSVVYTNPTQSNYSLLQINATGTSADGTSTRVASQKVYAGVSSLKYSVTTQRNFTSSGNVTIKGDNGIDVGGTVTQSGNSKISQITQPDTELANMDTETLFSNIFGVTKDQMKDQSTIYANGNGVKYDNLSGIVWINSNVTISGNHTIGSPSNPVLLIVNGSFTGSGTADIYGLLYVMGTTTTSGNFSLQGGLVSQGSVTMSGTSSAYDTQIVNRFTAHGYAKLPGSWKDF